MDKRNKNAFDNIATKWLDDAAKFTGDVLGGLGSLKTETESLIKNTLENLISKMDLVTREEYNVLKDMCTKQRLEQEQLTKRLLQLEEEILPSEHEARTGD